MKLSDNAEVVFHGFLNLPNLEKLSVVEAINEYFDSTDKEEVRTGHDARFAEIDLNTPDFNCVCCGR